MAIFLIALAGVVVLFVALWVIEVVILCAIESPLFTVSAVTLLSYIAYQVT